MKASVVAAVLVIGVLSRVLGDPNQAGPVPSGAALKSAHQKVVVQPPAPPQAQVPSPPLVVRGWEIKSVSAMKGAAVKELYPEYRDKKFFGVVTNALPPAKGSFLVVLVQSQSATGQDLNEPLWLGKPDVVLVDELGFEYAPEGKLIQQAGEYLRPGMMGKGRAKGPRGSAVTSNSLVYFDVPNTSESFWLRFANDPTLIPVTRQPVLPNLPND